VAVARAESGTDHRIAQAGHHRADLVAVQHPRAGVAAFVVHAGHQCRAVSELRLAEAKNQAARLVQRNVRSGGLLQRAGEARPKVGGAAGPVSIGRHAGALALHPDQAEIAARGAKRNVSLVDQRGAGAGARGAPGDSSADQAAADYDDVKAS
jgi:hypothetical protein